MKLTASAVKALALQRGLPVAQPPTLRDMAAQADLARLAPDAMVVAAYGLLLPPAVLAIPRLGCLNIHASLLPRWRGAAPVQRALLAGDAETGISIMQMDAGLDTGPVWSHRALSIGARETAGGLLERLTGLGAAMIVELLATAGGPAAPVSQPGDGVTYAHKIEKRDAAIDFAQPALSIDRQVRAFDPVPGAFCESGGQLLKIWRALPENRTRPEGTRPGTLLALDAEGFSVACGSGCLRVLEVQRAGGRRQPAPAYAQAAGLAEGTVLGAGAAVLSPVVNAAAPAPGQPR
jgi:methionyl-tRNA formyltransferase